MNYTNLASHWSRVNVLDANSRLLLNMGISAGGFALLCVFVVLDYVSVAQEVMRLVQNGLVLRINGLIAFSPLHLRQAHWTFSQTCPPPAVRGMI
jgi:hypothetical protein